MKSTEEEEKDEASAPFLLVGKDDCYGVRARARPDVYLRISVHD